MFTKEKIKSDLVSLGLSRGMSVVVHSSFKSLGAVAGGPDTVIEALMETVDNEGTLMMPTFTYSYAGIWGVSPFDPDKTPGVGNGIITEIFRQRPDVLRSSHPTYSVATWGKYRKKLIEGVENFPPLGRGSAFHRIAELGGFILLLGVTNQANSTFHLAEALAELLYNDIPFRNFWGKEALVIEKGMVKKVSQQPPFPGCSSNFDVVNESLLKAGIMKRGEVGMATTYLLNANRNIKFLVPLLKKNPSFLLCSKIVCEPCNLKKRRLKEL